MERIFRSDLLALAMMIGLIQVAACSPETGLRQPGAPAFAEAAKSQKNTATNTQAKDDASFEGDWAYRTDCDRGHYVTLTFVRRPIGPDRHLVGWYPVGRIARSLERANRGRKADRGLVRR